MDEKDQALLFLLRVKRLVSDGSRGRNLYRGGKFLNPFNMWDCCIVGAMLIACKLDPYQVGRSISFERAAIVLAQKTGDMPKAIQRLLLGEGVSIHQYLSDIGDSAYSWREIMAQLDDLMDRVQALKV